MYIENFRKSVKNRIDDVIQNNEKIHVDAVPSSIMIGIALGVLLMRISNLDKCGKQ